MEVVMNGKCIALLASLAVVTPAVAQAPVAGSTVIVMSAAELREVALGWSTKRQVLGKAVFNDNGERVGTVDDVIIGPDKSVSYVIVNAGGFIGVLKHYVAVPVRHLRQQDDKLVLPGATRDALKASPAFEYAN